MAAGKAKDGKMNVCPSRANTGYTPRPGPTAPMDFTPSRRYGNDMTSRRGSEVPETESSDSESSSSSGDVEMEDVRGWEKVVKKGKKEKSPKKRKKSKIPRKDGKVVKTRASKEDPIKLDDSDGSGDNIVVSSKQGKFEEIPRQKIKPRPGIKDAPVDRSPSRVMARASPG